MSKKSTHAYAGGAALSACLYAAGCTHWVSTTNAHPRQEVSRRLLGEPLIQEVTTHSVSGGFVAGASRGAAAGVAAGEAASVKRRQCVQAAEVDYVQQLGTREHLGWRKADIVGGVVVTLLGAYVLNATRLDAQFDPDAPPGYEPDTTTGYALGGSLAVGGLVWLSYPFWPRHAPQPRTSERRWTERTYVDATGCTGS